jgi:hypothetical protein
MQGWLLIFCASQIRSGSISIVRVSEAQCRAAIETAREMRQKVAGEIRVGAREHWQGARAICIAPDGKTRLDSSADSVASKARSK